MIAQSVSDPSVVGWAVVVSLLTITSLAANVATLVRTTRIQRREVTFGSQPVSRDVAEIVTRAVQERVQQVEQSIADIWATMRREDEDVRRELRASFMEIQRSLGRIEGQVAQMARRLNGGNA